MEAADKYGRNGWCGTDRTRPVGTNQRDQHNGVYDMGGNVNEWNSTRASDYFARSGMYIGTYYRSGGNWLIEWECGAAVKSIGGSPGQANAYTGFRLLREKKQ